MFAWGSHIWQRLCHVWEMFQSNHLDRDNVLLTEVQNITFHLQNLCLRGVRQQVGEAVLKLSRLV